MRRGKVSENIIGRSVIRTIRYKNREYSLAGASPGSDASVNMAGTVLGMASAGLMFPGEKMWYGSALLEFDVRRAFYNAINNVAAQCGNPQGIQVNLVLPGKTQEQDIKTLMRMIAVLAEKEKVEIMGGDTEVTDNVLSPMVHFTATGEYLPASIDKRSYREPKQLAQEGMEIVQAGYMAAAGTEAIVRYRYEELRQWFQESYLSKALALGEQLSNVAVVREAVAFGVRIFHDMSRGGICSALWELSGKTGMGVEVSMSEIPIRQETVEVCERYHMNPYKLLSNGAMLMVTENGEELCRYLLEKGINATVIGQLKAHNDKVLIKNEEKHYIEPPKGDELYLLFGR